MSQEYGSGMTVSIHLHQPNTGEFEVDVYDEEVNERDEVLSRSYDTAYEAREYATSMVKRRDILVESVTDELNKKYCGNQAQMTEFRHQRARRKGYA